MELGKWLKYAYAISTLVLLHINASLTLGHHHANVTRCVERERDALLAVKRDLVDNHNLLSSWDLGSEAQKKDCCRWERVYCDNQTGHVLRLDLGSDNPWPNLTYSGHFFSPAFEGTVSPQLIQLHDLTYLNLSYNDFNWRQIPAFIGSLTNLRYLDLSQGGFGGQIPSHALGNLTHLTYLDLSDNDFNGSQIPAFIDSLTSLRYLDLSWAHFGGQIPSHALGNLTHLTYLDLSSNDMNGSQIPAFIGSLTSLRYLDLSWAHFGGQIPSHALENLTHLQYLNLRDEEYYFPGFVENLNWLPHLSSLKYLDLSGANLNNIFDWLETVNKLPNLRNLSLSGCGLPPPILSTLSHINSSKSLASVDLSYNFYGATAINSSIFKWLCNYNTTLIHLDLSFTQLSGLIPNVFRNMGSLVHLYLYGNQFSGLIPDVFKDMSSLERLDLSFNQLSGLIPDIFRNMSSLEYLELSSNQLSGLIPDVFRNMSSLESLELSGNQLSGLIPDVFRNMSSLEYLSLSGNQLSGLIPDVFRNISSLESLYLSGNQLSGSAPNVFTNMSSLAHLDLSDNQLEGGIPKSISQLCSLQSLQIWNSSLDELFSEFVQRWSSTCPQNSLQSLDLSSNDLSGSFPNLTNFSSLKDLDLSENQLSGMVPESIGKLSSLEVLYLSQNGLSGMIPESIGNLSFLEEFYLSENNLSGMIPESIGQMSWLVGLDLSKNRLSGRIPQSIGQLSILGSMNLSMNSLNGVISETHFSNLSGLYELDLSSNSLVFNVTSDWVPPFQLSSLYLRSCYVGKHFPTWLRTQIECHSLDISYAGISDVLPSWFWDLFANIQSIDLSHNKIRGTFGSSEVVSFSGLVLDVHLSSNQFEGPIPSFLSNARYLDLSNNRFSDTTFLCAPNVKRLQFLDLSINNFSGELPNCWRHFPKLELLDLSNNSFSGKIPTTIGSLFRIETLKLRNNKLVGELPSALKNCTSLKVVDLGDNKLSRSVPEWLGVSLSNLVILILQSNQFGGSLPSQLCQLTRLQILDISMNEISGTIPKCLKNLISLAQEGNSSQTISHFFDPYVDPAPTYTGDMISSDHYDDEATFMWKARMSEYKSILGLVKSIDLSSNRLTGEIPNEIAHLVGLVSLNLSRNYLIGQIPPEIGKLKSLDSLDLSRNQIDGRIPSSLARIDRLGYLDLSYNNLSGEIPIGTQLQGRDPFFYAGNSLLCGLPLKKICDPEGTGRPNAWINQEDPDELITQGFYISLGLGFVVGFWGVCGSLIFKRSWRYAYYKFLNASNDWLYVKVALISRKLKDVLNR